LQQRGEGVLGLGYSVMLPSDCICMVLPMGNLACLTVFSLPVEERR
jgi:hypothetical protein